EDLVALALDEGGKLRVETDPAVAVLELPFAEVFEVGLRALEAVEGAQRPVRVGHDGRLGAADDREVAVDDDVAIELSCALAHTGNGADAVNRGDVRHPGDPGRADVVGRVAVDADAMDRGAVDADVVGEAEDAVARGGTVDAGA